MKMVSGWARVERVSDVYVFGNNDGAGEVKPDDPLSSCAVGGSEKETNKSAIYSLIGK